MTPEELRWLAADVRHVPVVNQSTDEVIAALESAAAEIERLQARDDNTFGPDGVVCKQGEEIDRITRERDEARAEVERLVNERDLGGWNGVEDISVGEIQTPAEIRSIALEEAAQVADEEAAQHERTGMQSAHGHWVHSGAREAAKRIAAAIRARIRE